MQPLVSLEVSSLPKICCSKSLNISGFVYSKKRNVWLTACGTGWIMQPFVSLECLILELVSAFHHQYHISLSPLLPVYCLNQSSVVFQGVINQKPGKISYIT